MNSSEIYSWKLSVTFPEIASEKNFSLFLSKNLLALPSGIGLGILKVIAPWNMKDIRPRFFSKISRKNSQESFPWAPSEISPENS